MSEHQCDGVTRREVLIGAAGGLALAAVDASGVLAQDAPGAQVSGIVFEDRDGSGTSSAANPGLAGVLVSNGRDVAVTGPDGRYTLPLPAELNLTFEGLAPTGPLPASVDFPLHRQDESKAFNVVLVTDPQPETRAEVDFIR